MEEIRPHSANLIKNGTCQNDFCASEINVGLLPMESQMFQNKNHFFGGQCTKMGRYIKKIGRFKTIGGLQKWYAGAILGKWMTSFHRMRATRTSQSSVISTVYEYSSKPVQKNDLVPSYYAYKFYLAQLN